MSGYILHYALETAQPRSACVASAALSKLFLRALGAPAERSFSIVVVSASLQISCKATCTGYKTRMQANCYG